MIFWLSAWAFSSNTRLLIVSCWLANRSLERMQSMPLKRMFELLQSIFPFRVQKRISSSRRNTKENGRDDTNTSLTQLRLCLLSSSSSSSDNTRDISQGWLSGKRQACMNAHKQKKNETLKKTKKKERKGDHQSWKVITEHHFELCRLIVRWQWWQQQQQQQQRGERARKKRIVAVIYSIGKRDRLIER